MRSSCLRPNPQHPGERPTPSIMVPLLSEEESVVPLVDSVANGMAGSGEVEHTETVFVSTP